MSPEGRTKWFLAGPKLCSSCDRERSRVARVARVARPTFTVAISRAEPFAVGGGSINGSTPEMDGLQWKIPLQMDDLGLPLFQETSMYCIFYTLYFLQERRMSVSQVVFQQPHGWDSALNHIEPKDSSFQPCQGQMRSDDLEMLDVCKFYMIFDLLVALPMAIPLSCFDHHVASPPGGRSFCPAIWLMENEVQTEAEIKRGKWWTKA